MKAVGRDNKDGLIKEDGLMRDLAPQKRRLRPAVFVGGTFLVFIAAVVICIAASGGFSKDKVQPTTALQGADAAGTEGEPGSVPPPQTNPPSESPTNKPANKPTNTPTNRPSENPTRDPTWDIVTYRPGMLTVQENGLLLSQGLTSRIIARSGEKVPLKSGGTSAKAFHGRPDFGATFAVPKNATENRGGWVYVSNSEMEEWGEGGVGAITFDRLGNVINYDMLLTGTTMNCGGGKTPWNTWVSCEEYPKWGQIFQVDPFGKRKPQKLTMGMEGGRFESFAYDDRDRKNKPPTFFVTEDQPNGPTMRWTPDESIIDWENSPWDMLHGKGTLEFLTLHPDPGTNATTGKYEWVSSIHKARKNAHEHYPSTEGIDRRHNLLYTVSKGGKWLFIFDLNGNTYKRFTTEYGLFDGSPDQVQRLVSRESDVLYYTEDGGSASGIHGRNSEGQFYTILEGPGWSDETSGLAFDPSGMHMYVAFQNSGVLFDITRTDGLPFYGLSLDVRYHNVAVDHFLARY